MTAQLTHTVEHSSSLEVAERTPCNRFDFSLMLGFKLSDEERDYVAGELRKIELFYKRELVIPARQLTGDTKGMSPEQKQAIRDRVDAMNADRTTKVREFFAEFLPTAVADLLSKRLGSSVTAFVALHCKQDRYFTLIVERD